MRWCVTYHARKRHAWRDKGEDKIGVHVGSPHDWHAVIDGDPGEWVRGLRAKVDAMLDDPQADTAFTELLDIYTLEPLDAEARKARSYWTAVFEPAPEKWRAH